MEYHWILLSVFLQLTFHPGKTEPLHLTRQFTQTTVAFEQRKGFCFNACYFAAQCDKDNLRIANRTAALASHRDLSVLLFVL